MAGTSFDSWDDEMTVLTEKLAIPAGNTAGLRLALPEPYNLVHGTGPFRIGMRLVCGQYFGAGNTVSSYENPSVSGVDCN